MVKFSNAVFCLSIASAWVPAASGEMLRSRADRIRHPEDLYDSVTTKFFKSLSETPLQPTRDYEVLEAELQDELQAEVDQNNALINTFEAMVELDMSMQISSAPSSYPSDAPSAVPTSKPSSSPSISAAPTTATPAPTVLRSSAPTGSPTSSPTQAPTASPTNQIVLPTGTPTASPTAAPTEQGCGISTEERIRQILALLDSVADPAEIRNNNLPQGQATTWLLTEDAREVCPDDPKILQRWTLAVIYYSTNGDSWFQCSANPNAVDNCGVSEPFVGENRFLSSSNECQWAGLSCIDGCVTEIEFEENNLVGTIPSEMALLTDLAIWAMERGQLTSTIPTEIGLMTNLIFLDLDFNALTGSLSNELLSLSSLTQLDLNNNQLTGSISGIGVFPQMEFLQLHDNLFTGTVPEAVGTFANLAAFTLHETGISGNMPSTVCNLLQTENNGGVLGSLIADCSGEDPDIECDCCTDCRNT